MLFKSKFSQPHFLFSSSQKQKIIFIAAGSPSHDLQASLFMHSLNQSSNNKYTFVGIGGPLMHKEGLHTSYANINNFLDKPFFPLKSFLRFHIARVYHPYLASTHYANGKVLKEIAKSELFQDIVNKKEIPSAFITFGNEFFMQKLYLQINDVYEENKIMKPPTFFYNRSHANQRFEFKEYLDHFFYTIPQKQINFQNFTFPSTCVGHEGVGRAIQYLYLNSKKYADSLNQGAFQIAKNPAHHQQIVEKLVEEQRNVARKALNIPEDQNVFLLIPGNTESEIKFALSLLQKSLVEFFKKPQLTNLSKSDFSVLISSSSPSNTALINDIITKNALPLQCQILTGEHNKFGAMCAADVGIPMNGEVVSECAALQLPSVIISNMPFARAYLTQLYNNFYSDINYSIQGEAYHELVSTAANQYKLADEIFEIYNDPKLRYFLAKRYANVVHQMIPQVENQNSIQLRDVGNLKQIELNQGDFSYQVMSQKVLKAAQAYEEVEKVEHYKIEEERKKKLVQQI